MKIAGSSLVYLGMVAILAAGIATAAGCGGGSVAAPTGYSDYNSPGGTFACEYPQNWERSGGGKRGLEWAKFISGPAEIRIDTGVAGSLMGDIAGSLGGKDGEELGPEFEPVHSVHQTMQRGAEQEFSGYKESEEIEVFEAPIGPARRSEFTAASTFGSGLHGYRATLLTKDKGVYVFCVCPESEWQTLQPAFDHVLTSLRRGQAE